MRWVFSALLPLAQSTFAIVLLLTNCGEPRFRPVSRCDWDPSAVCGLVVLPAVATRFAELNLPAVPLLEQPYVWLGGPDHPNLPWLVTLLGFAGLGLWLFVGRFLDDLIGAVLTRPSPGRRICSKLCSVFVIISSCIVWIQSDITSSALSSPEPEIRLVALCWLVFGCITLLFQGRWSRGTNLALRSLVLS